MIIAGLDPSFTSTGVAILDTEKKTIKTKAICFGCPDKSFDGMQKSIIAIIWELEGLLDDANKIVMEQPFAGQIFSAGLYGLDSAIYQHFRDRIVHTYHPTSLRKIHGKKYTKTDSKHLAANVIEMLEKDGHSYINNLQENKNGKLDMYGNKLSRNGDYAITSDESEAFLYVVVTAIRFGVEFTALKEIKELLHTEAKGICDWECMI